MSNDLTVGKPFKVILAFALPMIIGNIFQQLYNIVDTAVVGKFVSSAALAGVGSTASMIFLIVQVAMGASVGCSVVISQLFGAKKLSDTKTATYTTLISMGVMGLAFTVFGIVFLDNILTILQTPADIYSIAKEYLQIYLFGCFFMLMYNGITSAFNALGESRIPLYFLIGSSLLNVGLDLLFVITFKLGVAGVAWATFIAQALACIFSLIVLLRRISKIREKASIFNWGIFKKITRIALPSMLQQSVISVGHLFVQSLVNSFGQVIIAGFTAATKVEAILTSTFVNIGNALSSFTAQNIGCNKPERIKAGFNTTILLMLGLSLIMVVVSLFFSEQLLYLFLNSNDKEIVKVGVQYLQIVGYTYIFCGTMVMANCVLRGSGDVKIVVVCSVVNIIIRVSIAYIFAGIWGYSAIWWAVPMGWVIGSLISLSRYFSGKWKTKAIT